jgi:hypothetical protein
VGHVLPAPHEARLAQARVYIGEVSMEPGQVAEVIPMLLQHEGSLSAALGEEVFGQLVRRLGPQMPAPLVDALPAWVVAAMLQLGLQAGAGAGEGSAPILDLELQRRAQSAGLALAPVESLEQQFELLNRHDAAFVEWLGALSRQEPGAVGAGTMVAACASTDPTQVEAVVDQMQEGDFNRELIAERNHRWLEQLRPHLQQGGAFVAVGAAHLVGPEGLVRLLQGEGWTVVPLRAPARSASWSPPSAVEAPQAWPAAPGTAAREAWMRARGEPTVLALCSRDRGVADAEVEGCLGLLRPAAQLCAWQLAPEEGAEAQDARLAGACIYSRLRLEELRVQARGSVPG